MKSNNIDNETSEIVVTISNESILTEIYNEMRRYRDKQMEYQLWFTNIMLGIIAGIFTLKNTANGNALLLQYKYILSIVLSAFTIIICRLQIYMNTRYFELRHIVDEVEPNWKKGIRKKTILKPPHYYIVLNILFLLTTMLLMLSRYRGNS